MRNPMSRKIGETWGIPNRGLLVKVKQYEM
jgi:hypothetical protein